MGDAVVTIVLSERWDVKLKIDTDDLVRKPQANIVVVVGLVNQLVIIRRELEIIEPRAFVKAKDDMGAVKVFYIFFVARLMLYFNGLRMGMEDQER